jgi:hypothetical protein
VVRELQALGFGPLSRGDLVELGIRIVTPEYARALRAAGIATVADLVDLRFRGVPAAYAEELATLGYRALTGEQLVAMARAGVTPSFVRALRASVGRDLTPDELVERRARR